MNIAYEQVKGLLLQAIADALSSDRIIGLLELKNSGVGICLAKGTTKPSTDDVDLNNIAEFVVIAPTGGRQGDAPAEVEFAHGTTKKGDAVFVVQVDKSNVDEVAMSIAKYLEFSIHPDTPPDVLQVAPPQMLQ